MNSEVSQLPAPFENNRPVQNFLIVLGMYLIGFTLANGIGILCLVTIGHKSLLGLEQIDYSDPSILLALDIGQIIGAIITFLFPVILFSMFVSKNRTEYLKLNHGNKLIMFLLGGVLMICAIPLINFLAEVNSHVPFPDFVKKLQEAADQEQEAFLKNQSLSRLLLNIFMIGILAAIGEELFFRAVLQKIMIQWTNSVHWGVWVTGVLFSCLHFEFYGFLPRMLMGVYLGYLFVWTGSIWVPIAAHFLNNAMEVGFKFFEERKLIPDKIDEIGTEHSQIIYVMGSTVIVGMLLLLIYKLKEPKPEPQV